MDRGAWRAIVHYVAKESDTTEQHTHTCCLQKIYFRSRDTCRLKMREKKNVFHANGNEKKAGVAIFMSDKIDLKIKTILRYTKGTT